MKIKIHLPIKGIFITTIIICLSLFFCYIIEYSVVYNSIKVKTKKINVLEYGNYNYDVKSLVKNVEGEVLSVKKDIDINKVGKQKAVVEVKKGEVVKEVSINVEVKDTIAPAIKIKSENVVLTEGDTFDFLSNLDSVYDQVDGDILYQQKEIVNEDVDTNYYTVYSDVNVNKAGTYPITIKAVDRYGNLSLLTYNVEVKSKPSINFASNISYHNDYVASGDVNGLVNLAYSLVGSPYVSGGASPAGFDCSGFVYYLYSQMGISISRGSSGQINDGVLVSYEAALPGDILSWGYVDGVPTHSALYVGNGKMIHATNPKQGVIVSDVEAWTRGSGTRVIAVRRI